MFLQDFQTLHSLDIPMCNFAEVMIFELGFQSPFAGHYRSWVGGFLRFFFIFIYTPVN